MTRKEKDAYPPKEIWGITVNGVSLAPPIDSDSHHSFLAYPCEEEARIGMEHQKSMGWFDDSTLDVVRLK